MRGTQTDGSIEKMSNGHANKDYETSNSFSNIFVRAAPFVDFFEVRLFFLCLFACFLSLAASLSASSSGWLLFISLLLIS